MSVLNMSKNIKMIHPNYLICYRVGAFVNCYGKDAYILSYLFNYKINKVNQSNIMSGFPKNALPKVTARIQREKINYIILDTRNNYDIDEKEEYGNLNRYDEIMDNAQKYVKAKFRVQQIADYLLSSKDSKIIGKIENIIYENRKI